MSAFSIILFCCYAYAQQQYPGKIVPADKTSITVEVRLDPENSPDSAILQYSPVEIIGNSREWESVKQKTENGIAKWIIPFKEAAYLNTSLLFKDQKNLRLLTEPGDNVQIALEGKRLRFQVKDLKNQSLHIK